MKTGRGPFDRLVRILSCCLGVKPEAGIERFYPVLEAETVRFGRHVVDPEVFLFRQEIVEAR